MIILYWVIICAVTVVGIAVVVAWMGSPSPEHWHMNRPTAYLEYLEMEKKRLKKPSPYRYC